MTGVVERNLSQSQILKGIQEKNTVAPKDFFLLIFRDEIMGYKGESRLVQGEIFDLKAVKYVDESKSLRTQSFLCLC